ncbi:MAG: hypothetical protein AB3N63_13600 [Puniceicoccaceae bacterium]
MKKIGIGLSALLIAIFTQVVCLADQITGPGTNLAPFVVPTTGNEDIDFYSIVSAADGEPMFGGYFHTGSADGTAAFDNGNGTFTILVNHEIPYIPSLTVGFPLNLVIPSFVNHQRVLAHGGKGAHVAKWVVNRPDHASNPLGIVSGEDLIKTVYIWDKGTSMLVQSFEEHFQVFCSSDMAAQSAFYNSATGNGTNSRIYMTGEEFSPFDIAGGVAESQGLTREQVVAQIQGSDYARLDGGRPFAIMVDGPEAGTAYELAAMGNMNFENVVASPFEQEKTVVLLADDDQPGQVYIYIGTKNNTSTLDIDKAGLTNGKILGMQVNMQLDEANIQHNDTFTFHDFGDVRGIDWTEIETTSDANNVTRFSKPEDMAWDTQNSNRFYFVTSGGDNPARLFRATLNDISQPELGGTLEILVDGLTTPPFDYGGFDNITCDYNGDVIITEDGGFLSRLWFYDASENTIEVIANHNPLYFENTGQPEYISSIGEISGILDLSGVLGDGWYVLTSMAHVPGAEPLDKLQNYQFNPPYYEESQLLLMKLPTDGVISPGEVVKLTFGKDYILRFETTPGINYQVQSSPDMDVWTNQGAPHTDDGSGMKAVSVTPASSGSTFYRVVATVPDG